MLLKFPTTDLVIYNPKVRETELLVKRQHGSSSDSVSDSEVSEKSYAPLFTETEFWEAAVTLNFNLTWIFITIMANTILYFAITHKLTFGHSFNITLVLICVFCYIIIIVDAVAHVLWVWRKDVDNRTVYRQLKSWTVYLYLASLISIPFQMATFYTNKIYFDVPALLLICVRFLKIYLYVGLMQNSPGQITIANLYKKYFILWVVIIHAMTCVWVAIGCNEGTEICDKKFKGPRTYWNSVTASSKAYWTTSGILRPVDLYWVSANFVLGGFTSLGRIYITRV
ncbi:hypothetical protein QE152_g9834 [Popillia japonica]|uniref:Uncharacterized protein n=1 Tax=Popillia japonica TaxID=7064 RepID=A0AAW1LTG2_POPJA